MVINYQYKIQWIFDIRGNFIETKASQQKRLFNTIKCLGARSFTKIHFRDSSLKTIQIYNGMVAFPTDTSDKETIKYIKEMIKTQPNIKFVELIRK